MATEPDIWEIAAPLAARSLSDVHRAHLEESGIAPDVIQERGYYSLSASMVADLVKLEVLPVAALKAASWMAIPITRPDGVKHCEVIRVFGVDWKMKYLWPTGVSNAIDVHPSLFDALLDREVPLVFTEGSKKADALLSAARKEGIEIVPLSLNGCWGWRATVDGGKIALQDFHDIPMNDRRVYIVSDSDFRTNDNVSMGWTEAAWYLESKTGPHKTLLVITPPEGLSKQGCDDYLIRGGTLSDLLAGAQTPKHAIVNQTPISTPLALKSARDLIDEAGTHIPHILTPLIPERSIVLMAGHSGTYKTWHGLALALDLAIGLPWLGHPELSIESDPVVSIYVNKEMSGVILGQRLKSLSQGPRYVEHPGFDAVVGSRLFVIDEAAFDLREQQHRDRLEDAILLAGARLVFIDSLSMSWTGEENSSTEVGQLYKHLRGIIERARCSFCLIHHLTKPQSGPSRLPIQFAIRGSGQLYQQADAALVFESYESPRGDSIGQKIIAISHPKARTSVEMPTFLVGFSTNDGSYASLRYQGLLSDTKAREYLDSRGNIERLADYCIETMWTFPVILPSGPGLRTPQLIALLKQNWPEPEGSMPSDASFRRALLDLVGKGHLETIDMNQRLGNLYRIVDSDEAQAHGG